MYVAAMQNSGLVVGMTQVAFEQPEADLNAIMPIYIALMTSAVSIPMVISHFVVLKYSSKYRNICEQNKEALQLEQTAFDDKHGTSDGQKSTNFDRSESES